MTTEESWQSVSPSRLTWPEVDPARHPFDATAAYDVVRAVAAPAPASPRWVDARLVGEDEAERWRAAVSHALVDRYGRWAGGWCWSVGEGDYDGGPVDGWCCAAHSITTEQETLTLIADSLIEWRHWLENLAERFDRLRPLPDARESPGDLAIAWEVAVAQLVNMTVDRTRSDSGWYGHCRQVLAWFLTAAGVPESRHRTLIGDAIGGRFRSWVEPTVAEVTEVAERLAHRIVGLPASEDAAQSARGTAGWPDTWPQGWPPRDRTVPSVSARPRDRTQNRRPDDLEAWQAARARVDWSTAARDVPGPARTSRDAIVDHVAQRPEGSQQLSAALAQVRRAAAEGGPLTFAQLAQWQRTVLGVPDVGFRAGPAWAKGGRERYHWHPDLSALFEKCLTEAIDDDLPLPSRAARVYLDVAFFHPFDDGNARSAMLALYYVLAREDVVLDRAAPLLVTVRQAHDKFGAAGLAKLIELLIDATRARMRS
ncbi:hypothetical protein GCM10027280_58660 [Micromonospora polyrhachis]|uniref:Fido domain-containing protein n=1 Tax=Micromonospora polyrhachis TaxID=1282883 RepID=A0A7W7SL17_9ACTN|nr:Fic family protein [Micromonospora polyrhachis]MBB4956679.1 hypothetical protein [Micromonospora polyrhachis]